MKRLLESNRAIQTKFQTAVMESLAQEIKDRYALDINKAKAKELLDFSAPSFSIKDFRESVYRYCKNVREADNEGALSQLMRAGINMAVNSMYEKVPTNYEKFVQVVPSTHLIELYAPLARAGFIKKLAHPNDEPAELSSKGLDIQIRTGDFGGILTISKTAIDDDQSSQLMGQANQAGENAAILKDSYAFCRWLSVAASANGGGLDAGGNAVPLSETGAQAGEMTWPWNIAFTNGGGQNRLTTYATLTYQALINARLIARQMKDIKGNKMLVMPNILMCGVGVSDSAHEMLDSKACGIFQAGKGFVLQQRQPLSVLQESPVSGPAFTNQLYRWRIGERYEASWVEPRFAVLISDGSI